MQVLFRTPVKHNGRAYGVGAIADLPDDEAAGLVARGSVDLVPELKPKAKPKRKRKAKTDE